MIQINMSQVSLMFDFGFWLNIWNFLNAVFNQMNAVFEKYRKFYNGTCEPRCTDECLFFVTHIRTEEKLSRFYQYQANLTEISFRNFTTRQKIWRPKNFSVDVDKFITKLVIYINKTVPWSSAFINVQGYLIYTVDFLYHNLINTSLCVRQGCNENNSPPLFGLCQFMIVARVQFSCHLQI